MNVRKFLYMFLYASSTIDEVYIVIDGIRTKLDGKLLRDPFDHDSPHERKLEAKLVSFRIEDNAMIIYAQ